MIKFKINGQTIDYPTCWDDVTFRQYLFIIENFDLGSVVAMLTGVDDDRFRNATIDGLDALLEATQFIYINPEFEPYYPQIGPFKLPVNKNKKFDIRFEALGQFLDMKKEMSKHEYTFTMKDKEPVFQFKEPIPAIKAFARYVAIYVQKIEDLNYIPSKVPEMQERVMDFKAGEVLAAGQFFFLKLTALSNGTHKTFLNTFQTLKNLKPVSTKSQKSSVTTG